MALIIGTAADDILDGTAGNDTVKGFSGDDLIGGGTDGEDILDGGDGNDTITDTDTGAADDILLGGKGDDILTSDLGNDRLDGGKGIDTMSGGVGDDVYVIDNSSDLIIEGAGEGNDLVEASTSYALADNLDELILTGTRGSSGTGNALDNIITGNKGANKLFGMDGNDTLDGGFGSDKLAGGLGDDLYIVETTKDKVFENAGEGNDTVLAYASYTLSDNVETLVLAPFFPAGVLPISGTGNALDNVIVGNGADNTLDGGLGADTLAGAQGDDTYIVDDVGDVLVEDPGEGNDTVISSISFDLTTGGPDIENLVLTGSANIVGIGNALDNVLTGNAGSNLLDGQDGNDTLDGGAGADLMLGGIGNDIFFVDDTGDVIIENGGEGTADHAMASVSFDMGVGANEVERLTLTGRSSINGTGNALDNVITGNRGKNVIDGAAGDDTLMGGDGDDTLLGGADNDTLDGEGGKDILMGGAGDDLYIVDSKGKTITELAGEGTDEVQSSLDHVLADEVENLTLTGLAAINGTGNALDNIITGNANENTLDGQGGADMLAGGGGFDLFIVDNAGDMVDASGGSGIIHSSVSWDLGVNTTNIDDLVLTGMMAINGTGNAADNTLVGNSAVNILSGGLGNDVYFVDALDMIVDTGGSDTAVVEFSADVGNPNWSGIENITLLGRGSFNATGDGGDNTLIGNGGKNTLDGGLGDDVYGITKSDVIIDAGGNDTIMAGFSYTLAAGMENIILTGTGNFKAFGDAGVNTITGNSGKNTLDGMGGLDTLMGGLGDDTYIVNNVGITISDSGGNDTVRSSISFILAGGGIETLVLTGAANIDATGDAGANTLIGNSGDNTLDGMGGADFMQGGKGNDTFLVDDANDVTEDTSGIDTVIATDVNHELGKGLENLFLVSVGVMDIDGIGNNLDNLIVGTDGDNLLNGGKGADTLVGGLGDDIYIVDNPNDLIFESINEGIDTVRSSATNFTLPQDTEILVLTGGDKERNGTGNALGNTIIGNDGKNKLFGMSGDDTLQGENGSDILNGGTGDDVLIGDADEASLDILTGGEGADGFKFLAGTMFLPDNQMDLIRDYSLAEGDYIDLSDALAGIFDPLTDMLDDFVLVNLNGIVAVDVTGSAGTTAPWMPIAMLQGVHGVEGETTVLFLMP